MKVIETMCGNGRSGPSNASEALAWVRTGLDWLADADATELTGSERADCLRELASAESVHLAATARILSAFDKAGDCSADGQAGPRAWLRWQTRVSRPAAAAAMAWTRRLDAHPSVATALAAGEISPSYARRICEWVDELPAEVRSEAEDILVHAAADGTGLSDLAALFEEIRARTARPDADDGDDRFAQRRLFLEDHYGGHAYLHADLTPAAAAAVQAVLGALSSRTGPEDDRTKAQRDHDALEEACRLLVASGCLPERAGQPVHIQLQMTLAQLLGHTEHEPGLAAEITSMGAAAPPGADCDATIIPIVSGTIDTAALAGLICRDGPSLLSRQSILTGGTPTGGTPTGGTSTGGTPTGGTPTGLARRAAAQLTIADALRLLSGPGLLASQLRGNLFGPAAAISLPLDIGAAAETIPAHIRRAVTRRDRHCRFPGCDRPPVACHVHHLRARADGGETSVTNCCLLCTFHHLIAVHRWGWSLVLNPDGTTVATSPDGRRVLHSHAPPTAA